MSRLDRYMLSELMVSFSFFALILVLVSWVNQAVRLFDRLIADGQTARVFVEFTILTLPRNIALVLPVAAFAAVLYTVNRLSSESEITVAKAAGFSPLRLSRPIWVFGLIVACMVAVLQHVLLPLSSERLAIRTAEIAENASARLVQEGIFQHPGDGTTFYLRELTADGVMLDVFLNVRDAESDTTYTSNQAFLLQRDAGPQLVMIDGLAQVLDRESNRLFTTKFNDFVVDFSPFLAEVGPRERSLREMSTGELLTPTAAEIAARGTTRGTFLQEAHERLSKPLFPLVAALMGFAVLLSGGFSRFGIWRQILVALVLLVILQVLEGSTASTIRRDGDLWPVIYLPYLGGLALAVALLAWAGRTRRVPPAGAPA
ncbi:MAG: LPS export ABC transporter permease LptF [Shimia sp.]